MSEPYRVLIIGAGLAGLTAADVLTSTGSSDESPIEVTIVDKARGPGGRLATRRIGDATLDHGAQFFTVRSEDFRARVDRLMADGVVEEWCRGFDPTDGYPRYRTAGGMNRLGKHLAAELTDRVTLVTRQRVEAIIAGPDRWTATYEAATREPDEADAIIATPPVPQTVDVLRAGASMPGGDLGDRLAGIAYHKVLAVLATVDPSPGLPGPGALQRPDHPVFTFVADNRAKGISDEAAVTFHLAHALSAELWDASDEEVLATVDEELRAVLGPAAVTEVQVKRWRYAGPVSPSPEPSLQIAERPGPLLLAGDAFAGAKVEGAFLSGLDAGRTIRRLAAERSAG
ncbi:MAG: FAD-dependent oxidoreductase [Actinomycetota bacterium]